jgi:hypothetical protein
VQQLGLPCLHADGSVDHQLGLLGGIETQILDTVLVGGYSAL